MVGLNQAPPGSPVENRPNSNCVRSAEIRVYEQEVIVVPVLLLASFLVTLVFILLLRFCPEKVDRIRPKASKSPNRRVLHGIDRKLEAKRSNQPLSARRVMTWLLSLRRSTRYQCPGAREHRSGRPHVLLHLPPSRELHLQKPCGGAGPPTTASQFHSHCAAQGASSSEASRILQSGQPPAHHLLPALRLHRVSLQGPYGQQECGAAGSEWCEGNFSGCFSYPAAFVTVPIRSACSRHGQRHRETQLPELCILLGPAGSASLPAGTPWRGVAPGSVGDGHGGAGEQGPAQLPVAMQRGTTRHLPEF